MYKFGRSDSFHSSSPPDLRGFVAGCAGIVVAYCVTVLWQVATFPDVGLRCLLPDHIDSQGTISNFDLSEIRPFLVSGSGSRSQHRTGTLAKSAHFRPVTELRSVHGLLTSVTGRLPIHRYSAIAAGALSSRRPDARRAAIRGDAIRLPPPRRGMVAGVEIWEWIRRDNQKLYSTPRAGDRLIRLNGQPISTFLDFVSALESLRSAKIPPGGQLAPGSVPDHQQVPALVEVFSAEPSLPSTRLVEVIYRRPSAAPSEQQRRVYVPVQPVSVTEVSMTIIWFVCQLSILGIAITAYWYRPFDRIAQNFCLMCCASMGAFVPGFHWWILANNPLLNIPFILSASLLPSLVLNFFLAFPREPEFVRSHRRLVYSTLFGAAGAVSLSLIIVYWTAWALNGSGELRVFQKLSLLTRSVVLGATSALDTVEQAVRLLVVLRATVHVAIAMAFLYFLATVVRLGLSLFRIETPRERRQVVTILIAAMLSTIPIGYAIYLAFFRKVDFALGHAQFPMFLASMLFMAAYGHGIIRHRLMLAEEGEDRSRHYVVTSLLVSGGFATLLALGGVFAHSYSLPLNSTTAQRLSLFFILLLAAGLCLWVRDRLQAIVDRRFFSEKYQLDRAMQQLNRSAAYLSEPSEMADITLKTCLNVMDASFAIMYARDGQGVFRLIGVQGTTTAPSQLRSEQIYLEVPGENVIYRVPSANREAMSPVQELLHDLRAELLCVMEGDEGILGVILIGHAPGNSIFTAEDITFLRAMAQMSVLALHSSRANQAMARLDAELTIRMDRIAEQQRQLAMLRAELTALQPDVSPSSVAPSETEFERDGVRGSSPALLDVLEQVRKAARSAATVLIRGESGTGKELLARVIHRNSDRAAGSLVCVNCAALSPSLLESELFGHVRGAFTGAHADKSGRFLAAHGGTLFLDEIGDISLETQVKLLRVLQERCFEPVGSDKTVQVDVRLVTATNRNLEEMMSRGEFRDDLYYRLNVVTLTLPPLRERPEDLAELVFFFLSRAARKSRKQIREIAPDALSALEAYSWPGNIRELENVIERAVVLSDNEIITLTDLPPELHVNSVPRPKSGGSRRKTVSSVRSVARRFEERENSTLRTVPGMSEENQLREALRLAEGNKAVAARMLNLPRSTFFSKCRKYGLG